MRHLIALLLLLAPPALAGAEERPPAPLVGHFTPLAGDTLLAEDGTTKVRLAGIDAPEMGSVAGWYARQRLGEHVILREVICWPVGRDGGRDRHKRMLGLCFLSALNSTEPRMSLNSRMVQDGWAVQHRLYSDTAWLAGAELTACKRRAGLWSAYEGDCQGLPQPWLRRETD